MFLRPTKGRSAFNTLAGVKSGILLPKAFLLLVVIGSLKNSRLRNISKLSREQSLVLEAYGQIFAIRYDINQE